MSRSRTPPRATLRPVAAGPRQHAPNPLAQLAQAQQMLASGQHAQVEPLLHAALAAPPLRAEARYLMAIAALMAGQPVASVGHARAAADDRPDDARFHFALGRALKASGDLDGAESAYRRALELQPDYPEALVSLGIVLKTRGDTEGAIALYDRALRIAPGFAAAHANRAHALSLRALVSAEEAHDDAPADGVIEAHARAVALDPLNAVLHRNQGVLLMRARRRRDAADAFNQALALDPTDVESCLRLGVCLRSLGDNRLARDLYEKWLGLNPPNAAVMQVLAGLLTRDGQVDAARHWAEQAAALDADPRMLVELGSALMQSRRLEEALDHCRRALAHSGSRSQLHPMLLLGLNYLHEAPEPIFEAHAEFGRALPRPVGSRPSWQALASGEKLRVGFVSGDFVRHSVSYFMGGLFDLHDRSRFEFTCYHNLGWGDAVTERLKSQVANWVECEGLSDEHLRRRIAADAIHILVDLTGHTTHSRVHLFAQGAAPLQMTYLGYPTVSGVPANDFRITDPVIDPGDMPDLASERPLRLPRTMFCYRPDDDLAIGPPPVLRNGHITFGSFNNIAKVTDHTLDLWAQAMNAVPQSRLLLKSSSMAQASNRENIERFMAARGVEPHRLSLQPWIAAKSSHLDLYNKVDIALDPFPYNGATTTCEALWMGVPVVTRRGRTHTSRMGASILGAIGKPEWVTDSDADCVATLARLARDVEGLTQWRLQARAWLIDSELFDEAGFTRSFEALLEQAWVSAGSA